MRLAGGGAVSVEYSERKRREAGEGREREREAARQRRSWLCIGWWPCITHDGAALNAGFGVGGTSFTIRGSRASVPDSSEEGQSWRGGRLQRRRATQKKRFRKRSPRTHTYTRTHTQKQEEISGHAVQAVAVERLVSYS